MENFIPMMYNYKKYFITIGFLITKTIIKDSLLNNIILKKIK